MSFAKILSHISWCFYSLFVYLDCSIHLYVFSATRVSHTKEHYIYVCLLKKINHRCGSKRSRKPGKSQNKRYYLFFLIKEMETKIRNSLVLVQEADT